MSGSDAIGRLNAALEGRYRIERQLGEGGMATVYLADDLRHERKVALKVLKPELAAVVGAERFLAEIKTTANLQHPHILPLHDSGEADAFLFYVMPYIEGETLRERLEREKQLPVDEAVRIATDVAEALHAAHEQGVIHRDIKPANILLSRGRPLVADFGIALAVSAAGGGRLTETGLSMGTPYYMSPEQASADREASPASDVYSLGCVLYEMLVGEPPHTGGSAQAVLAKILMDEVPAATRTRASIPMNVDAAIRRALEKLPADRFANAQGFAAALADPGFRYGMEPVSAGRAGGQLTPLAMVTSGLAVLFAAVAAWALLRPAPEPVRGVERFANPFLPGQEHSNYPGYSGADLSPDGSMLVYRFTGEEGQILMIRRWDDLTANPVRESATAAAPAISLDGLELAFEQGGQIKVLAIGGGPVRTLLAGGQPEWGPDGYVYASTDSGTVRIPSRGGTVEVVSRLEEGEEAHFVRDVLPDGRHALLEVVLNPGTTEIRGVDLRDGRVTPLTPGELPRYALTGHLLYLLDGILMAARFDAGHMELLGTPIAVLDGVSNFSLADDGKLYYVPSARSTGSGALIQLAWARPDADATPVDPAWTFDVGADLDQSWSLSPDASRIALRQFTSSGYHIWVRSLETGASRQITFGEAHDKQPVWNPDGLRVTFLSDRGGNFDVWERRADGTGQDELILDLAEDLARVSWSPDGTWLLLQTEGPNSDILAIRPGVDDEPVVLLGGPGNQRHPAVSPDGRWIAYVSDETMIPEVYVSPFPDAQGGKWLVSLSSGWGPKWARSGRVLFFDGWGQAQPMMSAEVIEAGAAFDNRTPSVFSAEPWFGSARTQNVYEVTDDDDRLLVAIDPTPGAGDASVNRATVLVTNFFEELRRLVPVDR